MNTGVNVDQEARNMAQQAISRIEKHEAVCAEQQRNILSGIGELKDGMEGLFTRFWVAAISTIAMLSTACLTLIYMVIHRP